jgi:hypothetical protein
MLKKRNLANSQLGRREGNWVAEDVETKTAKLQTTLSWEVRFDPQISMIYN